MAVLKLIKRIFYGLCICIILLCALVVGIACSPTATEKLADMLYGEDRDSGLLEVLDSGNSGRLDGNGQDSISEGSKDGTYTGGSGQTGENGDGQEPQASPEPTIAPPLMDKPLSWEAEHTPDPDQPGQVDPDKTSTQIDIYVVKSGTAAASYVIPDKETVEAPKELSDKTGYTPVTDTTTQLDADEADKIQEELTTGESGDGLTFDSLMYPYYQMLDGTGQALYRQIYANANKLNKTFKPCQEITVNNLKTVFEAVYNDHPELFWLETGYGCRYSKDGGCVEITLQFNETAENLEDSKITFDTKANSILDNARNLADDYEKEKYVHDSLLKLVEYQSGAAMSQSAYSALVNGKTVCAGYARAFQYLMQQLGIPCYYCTGYSGQNHAWNIVCLYGDYYNVDVTWDDTQSGTYQFFNKTDADYASTHVRRSLARQLPACNGTLYRNLEESEDSTPQATQAPAATPDPLQISEALEAYYQECGQQIIDQGLGTFSFEKDIDAELWEELWEAYNNGRISDSFLIRAMNRLGGNACSVHIVCRELTNGQYRLSHTVNISK